VCVRVCELVSCAYVSAILSGLILLNFLCEGRTISCRLSYFIFSYLISHNPLHCFSQYHSAPQYANMPYHHCILSIAFHNNILHHNTLTCHTNTVSYTIYNSSQDNYPDLLFEAQVVPASWFFSICYAITSRVMDSSSR
jgi:hypothetical protein